MNVYIHLAEGFEEIEAVTVIDILRRAKIQVESVSVSGKKEVTGAHQIMLTADRLFEEIDYGQDDMIVLPGGMPGTKNLLAHPGLVEKIQIFAQQDQWLAAICAAPMILGRLGILDQKTATCFPGFEEDLQGATFSDAPVVQSGKIITSRGPGTAIPFALKIVENLAGPEIAAAIKEGLMT